MILTEDADCVAVELLEGDGHVLRGGNRDDEGLRVGRNKEGSGGDKRVLHGADEDAEVPMRASS